MSKKKKPEEPTEFGAVQAYVEAMELLSVARKYALERKDPDLLTGVANSWIEIARQFSQAGIDLVYDDDEVVDHQPKRVIGFTPGGDDEDGEDSAEDRG